MTNPSTPVTIPASTLILCRLFYAICLYFKSNLRRDLFYRLILSIWPLFFVLLFFHRVCKEDLYL